MDKSMDQNEEEDLVETGYQSWSLYDFREYYISYAKFCFIDILT